MIRVRTTATFDRWFAGLRDARAKVRIQMRIDRVEDGLFGDCEPVGEGVSEMRIDYGPGYRVYFLRRGSLLVVLLAGGDKRNQIRNIKAARTLARELRK